MSTKMKGNFGIQSPEISVPEKQMSEDAVKIMEGPFRTVPEFKITNPLVAYKARAIDTTINTWDTLGNCLKQFSDSEWNCELTQKK